MLIIDANYSNHVSKSIGGMDIKLLIEFLETSGHKTTRRVWVTSIAENYKFNSFLKSIDGGKFEVITKSTKEKRFVCQKCYTEDFLTVEKGNDVEIATQILSNAFKDNYQTLYLFSGDGDFEPCLKIVKELKKKIVIIGLKHLTSPDIQYLCDDFIDLSNVQGIKRERE